MNGQISIKDLTEEDIKVKYITPAIQKSNWDIQTQMRCEYYYTSGKINVRENVASRGKGKKVDYLLSYKSNIPIAIVEAKDNNVTVSHGIQQAMDYALDLDIPFAYSSNGTGFYEHDMITGIEKEYEFSYKKLRYNNLFQLIFIILGTFALFLATLLKDNIILNEIIIIGAWVLIWESIDLELFSETKQRGRRKILKRILRSEIIEKR